MKKTKRERNKNKNKQKTAKKTKKTKKTAKKAKKSKPITQPINQSNHNKKHANQILRAVRKQTLCQLIFTTVGDATLLSLTTTNHSQNMCIPVRKKQTENKQGATIDTTLSCTPCSHARPRCYLFVFLPVHVDVVVSILIVAVAVVGVVSNVLEGDVDDEGKVGGHLTGAPHHERLEPLCIHRNSRHQIKQMEKIRKKVQEHARTCM